MERKPLTFGSLFAGIGGFDLGLERAGMICKWQVELDDYASRVLAKHWPNVPRHDDVRTFPTAERDWSVDLICGGFPCQDISIAGKGAGLAGERSGLWHEFARIIRTVRPRWVVIENVPALTSRGLGTVLGDLAEIGFDAEWHCLSASAVGAPHRRDRIWIVANAVGPGTWGVSREACPCAWRDSRRDESALRQRDWASCTDRLGATGQAACDVAHPVCQRNAVRGDREAMQASVDCGRGNTGRSQCDCGTRCAESPGEGACLAANANSDGASHWRQDERVGWKLSPFAGAFAGRGRLAPEEGSQWETEPDVGRVADGIPARLDRLRGLGNSVVPQVVEVIGRAIAEAEAKAAAA